MNRASGFRYNGTGSKKGQGALQLAICYLEGETDSLVEKDGDGRKRDGRYFHELAMQHGQDGSSLSVYSMNIRGPYRQGAEVGEGQSMLVVTPEPWTLILPGTGLIGLLAIRRKI